MYPGENHRVFLTALILGFFLFFTGQAVQASPRHLKGKVSVEGGKSLKDLIVFLEPLGSIPSHSRQKYKVTQKGRKFLPSLLIITQGDSVQYLNDEDREIDHNIYSLSHANSFDLGLGERGTILEEQFSQTGKINYFCSVHKLMGGKVIVLPTRYFARLNEPGSFILPDVPDGKWKINVFVSHRRFKFEPIEITVGANPVGDLVITVVKK